MEKSESNPHLQAAIIKVLENQLRNDDPPQTGQTFKRLIEAGHSEKEAKRLIACVVSAEIFDVRRKMNPSTLTGL